MRTNYHGDKRRREDAKRKKKEEKLKKRLERNAASSVEASDAPPADPVAPPSDGQ